MKTHIFNDKTTMGAHAAEAGAELIRQAIAKRGSANIIVATGASQFEMLASLVTQPGIRWDRVTGFHLDEYVGISISHPASFRAYLWERFHKQLPLPLRAFHYLEGETDAALVCRSVGEIIRKHPIDVAFVGIGENGHLAFNDPPADFETEKPYLVVKLDDACRRQQMGEGWFPTFDDVPTHAISMSVRQIMKSAAIICTVPDERKAVAVRDSLDGPVTNTVPASILQQHAACDVFMDVPAASLLKKG
jgi:glucosamine-6-phosphate deaminase